jgi:hypothetical protein
VGKECGKECLGATNDGINHPRAWVKSTVWDYLVLGYAVGRFLLYGFRLTDQQIISEFGFNDSHVEEELVPMAAPNIRVNFLSFSSSSDFFGAFLGPFPLSSGLRPHRPSSSSPSSSLSSGSLYTGIHPSDHPEKKREEKPTHTQVTVLEPTMQEITRLKDFLIFSYFFLFFLFSPPAPPPMILFR